MSTFFFSSFNPENQENGKRVVRVGVAAIIIMGMLSVISIALMLWLLVRGISWLIHNAPASFNNAVSHVSWRDRFSSNTKSTNEIVQPIKVVSEESQVVDVVAKASPAVVSIVASAEVPKMEQCYQVPRGVPPEFQDFFGMPSLCQNGTITQRIGAGTGFLVSEDGFIITNKHVVTEEKAEYTVILNDSENRGKKVVAKVLARDPNNDIAILKIDIKGLPYLNFGNSDRLKVGQTTIAIGYALGEFDNTVSKGVVSGLARTIRAGGSGVRTEKLKNLIQTDTAINPGNSGGPLLDIGGAVIGVNVAMADAQSIGFAIPANAAKNAFEQVKTNGKIEAVKRAFLGVRYQPITRELKENNKLPYDYGMLVGRGEKPTDLAVVPGSPADKAGVVENDIILEADGKQLNESYSLGDVVENKKPGDQIELKVFHKGEVKSVKVILGENK
jgi:S1-C subfamily serine protease